MLRHGEVTWSNPRVLTTLVLIFVCGAAVGAVFTHLVLHPHAALERREPPAIERARHLGSSALKDRLALSAAQEQSIDKILDDYGKFYQNIEDEREDVAADGKRRILEVLTPEQQERFRTMVGDRAR